MSARAAIDGARPDALLPGWLAQRDAHRFAVEAGRSVVLVLVFLLFRLGEWLVQGQRGGGLGLCEASAYVGDALGRLVLAVVLEPAGPAILPDRLRYVGVEVGGVAPLVELRVLVRDAIAWPAAKQEYDRQRGDAPTHGSRS